LTIFPLLKNLDEAKNPVPLGKPPLALAVPMSRVGSGSACLGKNESLSPQLVTSQTTNAWYSDLVVGRRAQSTVVKLVAANVKNVWSASSH
jgi:hypothetical protein